MKILAALTFGIAFSSLAHAGVINGNGTPPPPHPPVQCGAPGLPSCPTPSPLPCGDAGQPDCPHHPVMHLPPRPVPPEQFFSCYEETSKQTCLVEDGKITQCTSPATTTPVLVAKTDAKQNWNDGSAQGHLEFSLPVRGVAYHFVADGVFYPAQEELELAVTDANTGAKISAEGSLSLIFQTPVSPDSTVVVETHRFECNFEYKKAL